MNPPTKTAHPVSQTASTPLREQQKGLSVPRIFTTPGSDPLEEVQYEKRASRIVNTDGSVVFEMEGAEIPAGWSQVATDIMVSKYFRKAGVPQYTASGEVERDAQGEVVMGPERSAKQVVRRLAGCWRHWGQQYGYFETAQDAQAFEDELSYMLIHQMSAPNSPQWFNTGLNYAYNITGPAQGHYYCDPMTGEVKQSEDAYTHPQPHACFIQSVEDDMVNEGGIMDLWIREARLFKYGSGTGTNFSTLRGKAEPLSGGGMSSGLMSFLKIGDRAAGAIKSGGTTRRAAKMVCLDLDHPDIVEFINWKANEEKKVAAMVKAGYESDFNGEAYSTVSGQNSNNSVRIPHAFFEALEKDADWNLYWRTELRKAEKEGRGPVPCESFKARDLWDKVGYAAWACADPGVQYDTNINDWHTCPADGRIHASNPCSEYMFLDNTACNLASINLLKFYDVEHGTFEVEKFKHAVRLWTVVLEISVLMAQFPSKEIAELSYIFRTLGLGYANLGALLMRMGIPYHSEKAQAMCGALTAILTGESYATSAEMAKHLGTFSGYTRNKEHMLRVIRNHRRAAYDAPQNEYEDLHVKPVGISQKICLQDLLVAAKECWDRALASGEQYGYRNAQATVIAPTGTIGLLMDCDTTGVEPDFALVKFKKLAGGGYMKIANQSVKPALKALGYDDQQIGEMMHYVMGTLRLEGAPHINRESLKEKGFTDQDIANIEKNLPRVFDLQFAFNKWILGEETMQRLGLSEEKCADTNSNMLRELGFTKEQIEEANLTICGHMTVEGAPYLKPEHLPVFDCANKCGKIGKRFIDVEGHIRMMAAAQPFISGAISKTINLPNEATIEDIKSAYLLSWKLGLKANALYRDGCKMSQALSSQSDKKEDTSSEEVAEKEIVEKVVIKEVPRRRKLPDERMSITHKFSVAGHEGYLHVGLYENGAPGEIFIKMSKEGSTLSGVMDTLALSLSMNLQYGVPLDVLCKKLVHTRFEPMGMTTNKEIPMVKSLMDYLGRWLAVKFLPKEQAMQFHNKELVEKAYSEGTKSKDAFAMRLPVIDEGAQAPSDLANSVAMPPQEKEQQPMREAAETPDTSKWEVAKQQGFTGSVCSGCGSMKMKRNGSCEICLDCGATSGCS
ncbi:ribonucleoside-diphosphate reductase, adenosylcobalamin-dependent [Candidatus Peregrinibacteria bacterium CG10_big_fil_rev_8_21_14_0_10_49_10]|nr:MAG: ribonucleoside-diphosphate reductase, adenosylcobalamin-dependent [Candidatus Peregrinibacteria bacterium CG10_big_fil_rev_8_21_14_0_10_49_10]